MRLSLFFVFATLFAALSAQTFTDSVLPLVVINTEGGQEIPDEPKITARMDIIDNGPGNLNRLTDEPNDYNGWIGIERRGSTSQLFPKTGFGLETRTEDGEDREVSILGFPQEEDWVLNGPYSDKSLIRNALGYSLAGEMMPYAPRVRMVELFINNDYRGVYLFTEKMKRDNDRIDVAKLTPDEIEGDDLTGGYILKFDKFTGENEEDPTGFYSTYNSETPTEQSIFIIYHYPKPADISLPQQEYIQDHIQQFEDALAGDQFMDPVSGYRPFVDLQSFVDYMIINEVSRNVDGYRLSSYFYKDRDSDGGKIHAGPIWDLNLAFGNANYCSGSSPSGWAYDFNLVCPDDFFSIVFWWNRLLEDPAFLTLLRDRWLELRGGILSTANMNARIDSLHNLLGAAPDRNFERWQVLGLYVWPNLFVGDTHQEEIDFLKTWVTDRLAWLDDGFAFITKLENERPAAALNLDIFPNPSAGEMIVRLPASPAGQYELSLADLNGKIVATKAVTVENGQISWTPKVPTGYYLATLKLKGKIVGISKWMKN